MYQIDETEWRRLEAEAAHRVALAELAWKPHAEQDRLYEALMQAPWPLRWLLRCLPRYRHMSQYEGGGRARAGMTLKIARAARGYIQERNLDTLRQVLGPQLDRWDP